jgi:A/G-specific adenine glycosylase
VDLAAILGRMKTVSRGSLNSRLFRWHRLSRRPLQIRDAANPWQVLVAEVMSQQTGIERVGPAWQRFMDRWPTPADLAEAGTHELLAAWAGLGYNRRALALRECARRIVADHGGRVPSKVAELESLPGIGPYTARAVAASAFGVPVAPLDVNVRRVVSRLLGVPSSFSGLQAAADELVSRGQPGRWLDAVMDLASGTCTARTPLCDACPAAALCASRGAVVHIEPKAPAVPFAMTSRWLRGRLVAAVAGAPAGTWVVLPERLGHHDADAIHVAARGLERDGFIDLMAGQARVRQ